MHTPLLLSKFQDPSENGHDETDLLLPSDSVSLTSTLSSESTSDYTDTESDPAVLKNRQFVYKELVATELDYIKDISTVIDVCILQYILYIVKSCKKNSHFSTFVSLTYIICTV